METLIEIIGHHLNGLGHTFDREDDCFLGAICSDDSKVCCQVVVTPLENPVRIRCSSRIPLNFHQRHLPEIKEFMLRANPIIRTGQLNLSSQSDMLCYASQGYLGDISLTKPLLQFLFEINLQIVDIFLPGVVAIVEDHRSAQTALELCKAGAVPFGVDCIVMDVNQPQDIQTYFASTRVQ